MITILLVVLILAGLLLSMYASNLRSDNKILKADLHCFRNKNTDFGQIINNLKAELNKSHDETEMYKNKFDEVVGMYNALVKDQKPVDDPSKKKSSKGRSKNKKD